MKQSLANINKVVVHCAYTPPNMDIGAKEINEWHLQRGMNGIAYHYVIRRNGDIENGRELTEVPAANGAENNTNTITICYVGGMSADKKRSEDNRTPAQKKSLYDLKHTIERLLGRQVEWLGHRDLPNVHKDCPSFDVRTQL